MKRTRQHLAHTIRECLVPEIIKDYYLMILSGKNPKIVNDARYVETKGLKVIADEDDARVPSPERRDAALKNLMDRAWGMPAQSIHIEAELRSLQITGQLSAADLAKLPPAALGRIAGALRGAIAEAKALPAPSEDEDVEDAKYADEPGVSDKPQPE